jgi:hypothetical protein
MRSKYSISGSIAAFALAVSPLFAADIVSLNVGNDGAVRVGEKKITLEELRALAVAAAGKDREVSFQVVAEADAPVEAMAAVMNTCRQAGVSRFTLSEPSKDNAELQRLYEEDQAERQPAYAGKAVDVLTLSRRDDGRERRVKALYAAGLLNTGADYYHAAMILQHAMTPDDFLLCHDLSVVAIAKGEPKGKWLAAASMDRFLVSVGRPQRFGTQYGATRPGFPIRMSPVDSGVTDRLRSELGVPPLAELKQRESKMDALFGQYNQPPKPPAPTPAAVPTPTAEAPRQPPGLAGAGLSEAPFVLGPKKFKVGDAIVIQQVLATSPNLTTGDRVVVRGRYVLASKEKATLSLYLSQTNEKTELPLLLGQTEGDGLERVSPKQTMKVERGFGEFELAAEVKHVGALHLTFYGGVDGKPFGGVYFGSKPQMTAIEGWTFSDYEQ